MKQTVAMATVAKEAPAGWSGQSRAGVRPDVGDGYAPDDLLSEADLLWAFRVQPTPGEERSEASLAVVTETAAGTWITVWSDRLTSKAVAAFRREGRRIPAAPVATVPGPNVGVDVERARPDAWGRPSLGGTQGHPLGGHAHQVATEAVASGRALAEAAPTRTELCEAMKLWGEPRFALSG